MTDIHKKRGKGNPVTGSNAMIKVKVKGALRDLEENMSPQKEEIDLLHTEAEKSKGTTES